MKASTPNTITLSCHPDNIEEFDSCPETAIITLIPELCQRMRLLEDEIERLGVYSIAAATACVTFHAWDEDEDGMEIIGEKVPTDMHLLHVTREGIWFSGRMEASGRRFKTHTVDLEQYLEQTASEEGADTEVGLSLSDERLQHLLELLLKWEEAREASKAARQKNVTTNKRIWRQYLKTKNEL